MIPRIGFSSLAAGLVGLALSFAPQTAQAHGHGGGFHGGGFHGGGFHGGGFHGGGFRGGFYGGGLGYGGFGRGFYGGGIYAGRGFYGGYRGFYPRVYGSYYSGFYGGFYPRYYGSYLMNAGYYGMGYGGYGGYGYGGYTPTYGNCTCGTSGLYNSGYPMTAVVSPPAGSPVLSVSPARSNPLLAYYLKNNPYNTPRNLDPVFVGAPTSLPANPLPTDKLGIRTIPAVLTDRVVPPAPAPML